MVEEQAETWWEGNESHDAYSSLYRVAQRPMNHAYKERKAWGAWAPAGIGEYVAVVGGGWKAWWHAKSQAAAGRPLRQQRSGGGRG